jgi:hypothetical protein
LLASGAAGCAAALVAGFARGQGAVGTNVELTVIHATRVDGGMSIDPQLKDLPPLTKDPFVRYNAYKMLDRKRFPIEKDRPIATSLVNGRRVLIGLIAREDVAAPAGERRYQLQVQIAEPGKKAFLPGLQVTAGANQPFFVGGQSYEGGTLLLELVVRPPS